MVVDSSRQLNRLEFAIEPVNLTFNLQNILACDSNCVLVREINPRRARMHLIYRRVIQETRNGLQFAG